MSIIADGANRVYEPLAYRLEADFEKQVVALADHIFGRQSIYVDVKKRVKGDDFVTIPDGYLIDMARPSEPRLYIIENEIVSHDPFKHVGIQMLKFATSFEDAQTSVRDFLMAAIQKEPEALQRLESGCAESGSRNVDAYMDQAVYQEFRGLVLIDDAQPALHRVIEKIRADISVMELRSFQASDGSLLHQFDTLYDDDVVIDSDNEEPEPTSGVSRRAAILARRAAADTIVVPAREDGFNRVFLGENRWWQIRIGAAMKSKLKYIAAYQVKPISAVTHFATIKEIRPWEDSGKYVVVFEEPAEQLARPIPIKDGNLAPQGPVYVKWSELQSAEYLDEALTPL